MGTYKLDSSIEYLGRIYHETPKGYYRNTVKGFLHRVIWEESNGSIPSGMSVDHINGNKKDNRMENLQLLTAAQNKQRSSNGSIRFRSNKYFATRMINETKKEGYFGTKCGAYMFNQTAFI